MIYEWIYTIMNCSLICISEHIFAFQVEILKDLLFISLYYLLTTKVKWSQFSKIWEITSIALNHSGSQFGSQWDFKVPSLTTVWHQWNFIQFLQFKLNSSAISDIWNAFLHFGPHGIKTQDKFRVVFAWGCLVKNQQGQDFVLLMIDW